MGGGIPQGRKSFTKIKNFTEKDQVRIKYSLLGKEKKLMLSVYIGKDVYNQLTDGKEYKRLNTTYIPGDMVVINPTNDDKGLIHRYNGSGMFKTTCVRISLGKMKGLKLSKRDFINRVVEYSILYGGIDEPSNALRIDISNSKKIRFTVKPQEKLDADKKQVFNTYEDTNLGYLSKPYIEKERYCSQLITPLGERVLGPSEETILTNTKADKKPDKSTYIPRMDHKLDEIQEKQEYIAKQVKDFNNTNHDISYRLSLLLQELEKNKEKIYEPIDTNKRMAMLEIRFNRLEKMVEEINDKIKTNNDKSLFEKIFGK